jgi:hypothetical protein
MSVRINLLPEARMIKLKNQQTKRLVTVICLVLCSSVGIILIVLLLLLGARNVQFSANKDKIDNELGNELKNKAALEQELAWFNGAVTEAYYLSDRRILISQLFDRLTDSAPEGVVITDLTIDADYKVKASVETTGLNNVALFMNALKTYNVTFGDIPDFDREPVFHEVEVETVSEEGEDSGADFEVTFVVDEKLVKKFRADAVADSEEEKGSEESQ